MMKERGRSAKRDTEIQRERREEKIERDRESNKHSSFINAVQRCTYIQK